MLSTIWKNIKLKQRIVLVLEADHTGTKDDHQVVSKINDLSMWKCHYEFVTVFYKIIIRSHWLCIIFITGA